jgi:hypothetical protein
MDRGNIYKRFKTFINAPIQHAHLVDGQLEDLHAWDNEKYSKLHIINQSIIYIPGHHPWDIPDQQHWRPKEETFLFWEDPSFLLIMTHFSFNVKGERA